MFGSGYWTGITGNAHTFIDVVEPLMRLGIGLALAIAAVAIGTRALGLRKRRVYGSGQTRHGAPMVTIQAPSSASLAMGGRASMPKLKMREKVPDWREARTHIGSTSVVDPDTGEIT